MAPGSGSGFSESASEHGVVCIICLNDYVKVVFGLLSDPVFRRIPAAKPQLCSSVKKLLPDIEN
jgi:hypothetical protein